MPNYEYECTRDGNRFELWQPVGEAAPPCPECQSPTKKVFHVPRVIFKGSGFYVTDLAREKEAKSGTKSSEPSGDKSSGSSGEAKSEAPAKTEDKAATPAPAPSNSTPTAPAASDKL